MIRYNHALQLLERGYWYIGRFGRQLWKHLGWLPFQGVGLPGRASKSLIPNSANPLALWEHRHDTGEHYTTY